MHFYRPQFFHTIELYFLAHSFLIKRHIPYMEISGTTVFWYRLPGAWTRALVLLQSWHAPEYWGVGPRHPQVRPVAGHSLGCCSTFGEGSRPAVVSCYSYSSVKHRDAPNTSPDVSYNFYAIADMCVCLGFTFMTTFFPFERNCDVYALWYGNWEEVWNVANLQRGHLVSVLIITLFEN